MNLVFYDISDNNTRQKVSKICLNYGLRRIQKSCYCGEMSSTNSKALQTDIKKLISDTDSFIISSTTTQIIATLGKSINYNKDYDVDGILFF